MPPVPPVTRTARPCMGHLSDWVTMLSTSLGSLGHPLLEPVGLQEPLLHEGVGVDGVSVVLDVVGLEGDQPPGSVLEGSTEVGRQVLLLPVRDVAGHGGAD